MEYSTETQCSIGSYSVHDRFIFIIWLHLLLVGQKNLEDSHLEETFLRVLESKYMTSIILEEQHSYG